MTRVPRYEVGDVGSAYPGTPVAPTPRSAPVPRGASTAAPAPGARPVWRRRLRAAAAVAAGVTAVVLAAAAWTGHAAATDVRVARAMGDGAPARPGPATLLRAVLQGPPTVVLQVGHLGAQGAPEELAALRTRTGASAGGVDEVTVNAAVADALAARLRADGIRVRVVGATVPPNLRASLALALHADGVPDVGRRGYKSAHAIPTRTRRDPWLLASVDAAYLDATPLPHDAVNVSPAMTDYYAFAHARFRHALHPSTAAVIIEMGYLSNPLDRAWLEDPDRPAAALHDGVTRYLAAIARWHPALAWRAGRPTSGLGGP